MLPISNAGYGIASRFCASLALAGWAEAEMCEKIQSLLSSDTRCPGKMPLELEIQKRECQTLIFLLKDLKWTPGERKTGIYNVKFCTQNTEHVLSIEYDSDQELLAICVDGHQSTEKLSIFNFAGNLAGLLGISINEVYLKLAGIDSKDVIGLFKIGHNQGGLTIFEEPVPRTRFDIKASTDALWTEYQNRFSKVWPSDGIWLSPPLGVIVASEFKNVAVTYILEKYLAARYRNHIENKTPLREEILDLGRSFSPTIGNTFGYFDVPLSYFDKVHLSWPWCGENCYPISHGACRDFTGLIVSAEMMVHDELNPFYGVKYYDTCKLNLAFAMTKAHTFSSQWLNHGRRY